MTDPDGGGLVEPEGVNAGPTSDDPSGADGGDVGGAPRRASSPSDAELDGRADLETDGTGKGSQLTAAGADGDGPGQELSVGEG